MSSFSDLDKKFERFNHEQRSVQQELEHWKAQERDSQEKLNEDSKDLEKLASKQALLLKKVIPCDLKTGNIW